MSFTIVAMVDTQNEAMEFNRIVWWAKVGCAFRDLTRTDEDRVVFNNLPKRQNGKMLPKV